MNDVSYSVIMWISTVGQVTFSIAGKEHEMTSAAIIVIYQSARGRVVLYTPAFIAGVAGVVPFTNIVIISVGQRNPSSESRSNFTVSPHWGFHPAVPNSFSLAESSTIRVIKDNRINTKLATSIPIISAATFTSRKDAGYSVTVADKNHRTIPVATTVTKHTV